ncbi:MAG: protein-disulfide reductase DsbD domain-containing protein [Gemmatimonadota bacterium]
MIREKYFEVNYTDRLTPNNVIAKLFPELVEEVRRPVEAPHLQLTLAQSDRAVIPGSRISLFVEVGLPTVTHVYSPDVKGYIPIALTMEPSKEFEIAAAIYPPAKTLYLEAIKEQVPVFDGTFRIVQDVRIANSMEMMKSVGATGKTIQLTGKFKYQACDDKVCYPPTAVPVTWQVQVLPFDLVRSPEAIRHQ